MTEMPTGVNSTPVFALDMNNIFLDTMGKIAALYRESMRANTEQLWMSSARIVQEHVLRALVATPQSCAEALAKNAADIQEQSIVRLASVNQKAAQMMGQAMFETWSAAFRPVRPV
jgi:hypothetical protein